MNYRSLLLNAFPQQPAAGRISNLTGSSAALLLALAESPFVALEPDEAAARTLAKDINFFRALLSREPVLFLPDPNGPETAGVRVQTMSSLGARDSLVTSFRNLATNLRVSVGSEHSVRVHAGENISRESLEELFVLLGYHRVPMVAEPGEYSARGWVIDIFPTIMKDPLRLEFFGDEIETLRAFDVETQRSKHDVPEFVLFPASEQGAELPLSEVLPDRRFYSLAPAHEEMSLPGDTIFLSRYSFIPGEADEAGPSVDAGMLPLRGTGVLPDERKGIGELAEAVRILSGEHRVLLVASSQGQSERLRDVLRDADMIAPLLAPAEVQDFEGALAITSGELSTGLFFPGLAVLSEKEIFGKRPSYRPLRKTRVANLLMSLDEISPGDFVVHREHGVGRFLQVVRQHVDENEIELMLIEYGDGKIYLPIQNIHVLSKYRAEDGVVPKIDKLSGKTWQKKKERARKKVHEIAARLVALYAGRKASAGIPFSPDTELHREFESFFSYEETPDQLKAISEIRRDMESDKPMERLLCGDVGYGKTEVAMRAAFKAVYDHRQVAVLVPTTILAEQHYRTFCERFSGFPVSIDFISRFKSKKEIDQALGSVARGETDIIIGTHTLLSGKVVFRDLGLLVIDEEHRFGVGQKERIKELRKDVDVLTLTATPIPRTLHMALSGIREISVIETPPEDRLAVKSIVAGYSETLIREAIERELQRDGQAYFVHNRILDIYKIGSRIAELVPSARIGVAHGQMPEKQLEQVMHDFFEGRITVLVSTAIIGSGLDVPRANTIIINMADRLGLADLYQIRGRVGRSSLRGYAFFLAPPEDLLTEEAKKRLQAVQEMSYLGAGFRLALKDLEIRGAGEIFGAEQSGHIHEIGFDLYVEMLEKEVAELRGLETKEEPEPLVEFRSSAFIPEEYVADVTLRMSLYRRFASLRTEPEAAELDSELTDRFGKQPEEVRNLFRIVAVKVAARALSILRIQESAQKVKVTFSPETPVRPEVLFTLGEDRKRKVRFLPDGFELETKGADRDDVFRIVDSALRELREKSLPEKEERNPSPTLEVE